MLGLYWLAGTPVSRRVRLAEGERDIHERPGGLGRSPPDASQLSAPAGQDDHRHDLRVGSESTVSGVGNEASRGRALGVSVLNREGHLYLPRRASTGRAAGRGSSPRPSAPDEDVGSRSDDHDSDDHDEELSHADPVA
jgi:hypothetical protein